MRMHFDMSTHIYVCRKNESQARDLKKLIREKINLEKNLQV